MPKEMDPEGAFRDQGSLTVIGLLTAADCLRKLLCPADYDHVR